MKIYVGGLSLEVTDDDLNQAFAAFGQVASATVIKDKSSGESRGFGFMEMPDKTEAKAAIDGLNGKDLKGKTATVSEARPRPERSGGGGYRSEGHRGSKGRDTRRNR